MVERAHLVGHSSGGNIALQLALDAPGTVGSLALLEPALLPVPSRAAWGQAVAVPAMERYRAGDPAGAIDLWMRGVAGPGYRQVMEDALPGALERAVADADTFFGQELPAVQQWPFGEADAARVTQPVLAVLGGASAPGHGRGPGRLLRPPPPQGPLTGTSWGWLPRWNGTMVTFTFSIEPSTRVRPAEVWSCRTRRQKPT